MTKIISISVPKDAEHLIDELQARGGSVSSHVVEAIRKYLDATGDDVPPIWFIKNKDYSHLPLDLRKTLVKFGYKDKDVG
jgi:hypothetical protein